MLSVKKSNAFSTTSKRSSYVEHDDVTLSVNTKQKAYFWDFGISNPFIIKKLISNLKSNDYKNVTKHTRLEKIK